MAILLKKQKLDNGIITDLYVKMVYYKANAEGIQCVCRVYASLESRKEERLIEPKQYYEIRNLDDRNINKLNTKEMWNYVYEKLTEQLGGTAELEFYDNSPVAIDTELY